MSGCYQNLSMNVVNFKAIPGVDLGRDEGWLVARNPLLMKQKMKTIIFGQVRVPTALL